MDSNTREYTERPYRRSTQNEQTNPAAPYFMGRVILTQFVIFILLVSAILICGHFKPERFANLKELYNSLMQKDMSASEVLGEVKSAFGFLGNSPLQNENADEPTIAEAATEIEENLDGAGGEDLIYPKENASFSPFYLSMPIVKPVASNRITSPFGYRINPVTNEYGFHSGLDLAAPEGTPIKAAFDGTVEKADCSKGRGNYIFLNSAGGIKTVYCHCSELLVSEGQVVTAGEIIAKVGSTGQATGPHLHFEIRINGVYYNPVWALEF